MATVGLIGAGNIGGALARLAVDAGYHALVSNSRGPETLSDPVERLGPHARAATAADAAAAGDLVVVTVPLKAYRRIPVEPLAGKVVIDPNNYYPDRDGHIAELDDESTTTSELLQAHLSAAHVVKVFNTIFFGHLATLRRPHGAGDRSAVAIAGDDPAGCRRIPPTFPPHYGRPVRPAPPRCRPAPPAPQAGRRAGCSSPRAGARPQSACGVIGFQFTPFTPFTPFAFGGTVAERKPARAVRDADPSRKRTGVVCP